jgi:hypothetical protein
MLLSKNRQFEHSISAKSKQSEIKDYLDDEQEGVPRKLFYQTLMQVTISHDYYNGADDQCADFNIYPTTATAVLMKSLGLIFKQQHIGFSIIYNQCAKKSLLDYLRRQSDKQLDEQDNWTRLSFIAGLTNQYFVNFTDLLFTTNPSVNNFYLTNQEAHRLTEVPDTSIILNSDNYISQSSQTFLKVVPVKYKVDFDGAVKIKVFNISGEKVLTQFKSVRRNGKEEDAPCDVGVDKCVQRVWCYIDFSLYPEAQYTIEWCKPEPANNVTQDVLYTAEYSNPLCFINLLLSQPTKDQAGIYPIDLEAPIKYAITPIHYHMQFQRRSTYWVYWIIDKQSRSLSELSIESMNGSTHSFAGPFDDHTHNKFNYPKVCYFVSKKTLALKQVPDYRFKLVGKFDHEPKRSLVDPLPVASSQTVLPKKFCGLGKAALEIRDQCREYSELIVYL